ncbi:BCCT family transporter [Stenotrophomonas sp. CFBP 13724]|jgi:choline/glycine/proline betaine transport protein|uniref:BCCT family transporter n=1 Tax=Stenotrophomonas sp. CFBP 13724 TaxID=2775298 RepID=UPI00177E5ED7|nr:BCCT family transporter [Stenotrophomonas sp. CFBP 13724]MBD8642970.1 BCCT family transporter [Stenotrophomonas sp. CFBP 13724]
MSSKPSSASSPLRLNGFVFFSSALSIGVLGLLTVLNPQASEHWLQVAQAQVSAAFGWWYMLLIVACLGFVLWLAFSRYGSIRLGHNEESPAFAYVPWVSMLFSAGIGIALLYYGAYEPLDHFLTPPGQQGGTVAASREAMVLTFLHWGLHGWALYALVGVALGYFAYRRNLPLALRSALYPIFGERIHGQIGDMVDGFGILATLVSMVTNLGIGALVVQSGLSYLFKVPDTPQTLVMIVLVMMVVATIGVVAGVEKGIAWLSNLNVRLLCLLLLFVLVTGPTLHLLDGLVQNTGDYLASFVRKSFDIYLNQPDGRDWLGSWTLFYWAWWIAWAPFVGLFVARISRGRTIREVILGVLLIPLGFTLAWLSIFGNTAIDLVLNHGQAVLGEVAKADAAMTLFKLLEYLPWAPYVAGAAVVIGFVLFLTPVDSGTLMIANLCTRRVDGGVEDGHDAPIWLRVFWAVVITVVSIGLLLAGNFRAMQTAVVLCGLPFSFTLAFYMVGLLRALRTDPDAPHRH